MLERLAGHGYYCFLNGFSGYFHIPIASEDQEKTKFTCPYGTFTYKRMPFRLCNAPATFHRCMTTIFHKLIEDSMEVFMDDFSVFGNSFDHCLKNLEKMLKRCEETNLVVNWEKCHFRVKDRPPFSIVIDYVNPLFLDKLSGKIGPIQIIVSGVFGFHGFPNVEGNNFTSDSSTQQSLVNVN
nr:RNA-directed DNA polymerase homolog [Tanacetum cinerariifolium]